MNTIKYDLPRIFQQAFGIRGYNPSTTPERVSEITYADVEGYTIPSDKQSILDTPVFEYLQVEPGTYTNYEGAEIEYTRYEFSHAVVVDISQPKVIVKTPVAGRDGTVKELISRDDYRLVFRGVIVNNQSYQYPTEAVQRLMDVFAVNKQINIAGGTLNEVFGITAIVIEDINLPRLEAMPGVQPFIMQCVSDEDFLFTLNE